MTLLGGWLRSATLALYLGALVACSPKAVVLPVPVEPDSVAASDTVSFVAKALEVTIPDFMAARSSWEQYQYALQAIDNEEWLLAGHYLDASLKQLVLEKYDSTYTKYGAVDSLYRNDMPVRILFALDEIYPYVSELTKDTSTYLKNEMSLEGHEGLDESPIDTAEFTELESFLDTLNLSLFSLPVELNERVMREIHYLTKSARSFTEGSLSRKTLYEDLIYAKLKEKELPQDLIFLSLVESGFKVKAYSRAKASGLWQFIPETGKRYGLNADYWVDMRRHPERATEAAIGYLTRLYNEFGDWLLAMAAYNCGEGRVRRLLREKKNDVSFDSTQQITYWDLKLPKETMHYVPRILAAMIVGHYPENYGLTIVPMKPVPYDTITVTDCLPLDIIADAVQVSEDSIRTLNPELIKSFTPPDMDEYVLRLPRGSRELFADAYDQMDKSQFSRWFHHKVKSGENLGVISRKYGLSVKAIQSANGMKNTRLRAGQTLLIPLPSVSKPSKTKAVSKPRKAKEYTFKLGDNLASIGRQFGVSIESLKSWNALGEYSILKVDDTLFVSKPTQEEKQSKNILLKQTPTLLKRYTIKEGDTYNSIALTLGVSREDLIEENGGMHKRLEVGKEIQIPFSKPKPEPKEKPKTSVWTPPQKSTVYTVRSGDNLYSISKTVNVSVPDLQKWNNKGSSTNIYPGEKLKLEGSVHSSASTAGFHVVEKGESLWDIARLYKVSITEIVEWNSLKDTKVKIGEKLKVKAN